MSCTRTLRLAFVLCLAGSETAAAQADVLDSLLNIRINSAAKYEQTISEVAGAVTIVTADDIARFGYRTVAEVLGVTRGFYISNDRNYTYVGVRGFSRPTDYNNRILILLDGQVVNEAIWGGGFLGDELGVELAALERIEIVRGPGSAVYGTGAVFAVVNLVTQSGQELDGGRIVARAGSLGARGASATFGRRLAGGTEINGYATWNDADGRGPANPPTNTLSRRSKDVDGESNWGVGGSVRRGNFTLSGMFNSRRKTVPTGAYGTNVDDARTWTVDRIGMGQLAYDRRIGQGVNLRARAYFNGSGHDGDYAVGDDIYEEGARAEGAGSDAMLTIDLGSANRLTVGAEYRYNWRAEHYSPRQGRRDFSLSKPHSQPSLYLQDEYQLFPTLSVLAGLRYDRFNESDNAVTPRGALIFTPSRATTLKLLYGRAYRAPSISEREPVGGYTIPDPSLGPEQGVTLELIYQQRLGQGILATASVFDYTINGLIDPVDQGVDEPFVFRNVSDARATGMELGLDARFGSMSGYASYSIQRAHAEATDLVLTNSPKHQLKGGVALRLPGGARPALEGRYESGRRTVADTWTDGFFLADLNLGVTPLSGSRSPLHDLEISVRLRNLFDTRYATPGGIEHLEPAIEQNGRTALVELRYRF